MGELWLQKTEEKNWEESNKNQHCEEKRQRRQREKSLGRDSNVGIV